MHTYGLLGNDAAYEYLKFMHESCAAYSYEMIDLNPVQADQFIKSYAFEALNIAKNRYENVMSVCDELSDDVNKTGFADTVVLKGDRLYGYNTAFYGLKSMLAMNDVDVSGKKLLVIGSYVPHTAKMLTLLGAACASEAESADSISEQDYDADIIIKNTASEISLDFGAFAKLTFVADLCSVPIRSRFIVGAEKYGVRTSVGMALLAGCAEKSIQLFGGRPQPAADLKKAALQRFRNIVLTGMPLSGKTTVGRILEEATGKRFADADAEIEKRAAMPISKIFELYGEAHFRSMERAVIEELSSMHGLIISTGGGAVMNEENWLKLTENGRVYCLKRDVLSVSSESRPLCRDTEAYKKLYEERKDTYKARCDAEIDNNISAQDAADRIAGDFYENTDN